MKNKCPKCQSINLIKRGFRNTQNRGKIQRFSCKDCKHRFVINDGFFRMRNAPNKITLCLDLFYRGISTRKIQEHLQVFYPHNSHYSNIYRWVVKYAEKISQFTTKLNLNVGNEIQVDEMEYKTKGKESWFIDSIDTETKFLVASKYVYSRGEGEVKHLLTEIKNKTGEQVKVITTDGFLMYRNIVKKTWGYNLRKKDYNIKHNVRNASAGEGFNYPVERLHNNIRLRTKTFRGFHGCIESANAIMQGYAVYYNFIRKHLAIDKCPYELAIPSLKFQSANRWLELIEMSK